MDLSPLRALTRNLNFTAHGLDVTVGDTPTRGIWITPETDDHPGSIELHRRERTFILAIPMFRIAKGTIILAPASPAWANLLDPPPSPGEVLRWELDGTHSIEADHTRVRLVLAPLEDETT
jgi:hypothetical protein